MADRTDMQTRVVALEGGLIQNIPMLQLGMAQPGALVNSLNFEPALNGGYSRLKGYVKWDEEAVPGEGPVRGVANLSNVAIAFRDSEVYSSGNTGWTQVSTTTHSGVTGRVRFHYFNWAQPTLIMVDGVNQPATYDGSTWTELTDPLLTGAEHVCSFKEHMFYAKGTQLIFSAPYAPGDMSPGNGAGEINVGHALNGIAIWRDELYLFCPRYINKLVGNNANDFQLVPVTQNMGCVAPDTVQELGGDLYYMGPDGFRTVAGTARIGDVELGSVSRAIHRAVTDLRSKYLPSQFFSFVIRDKSQYRVVGYDATESPDDASGLLMGQRLSMDGNVMNEWYPIRGIKGYCAYSSMLGGTELTLMGGDDGYVYRLETGNTFDGRPVRAFCTLPYMAFDDPAVRKTLYSLTVGLESTGRTDVNVSVSYDFDRANVLQPGTKNLLGNGELFAVFDAFGVVFDGISNFDQAPSQFRRVNIEGSGMNAAFTFDSYDDNPPYTIKSLYIEYYMGGRR